MIDESLIEIRSYQGEGYQPLITFASWRVAVLNYLDELHPSNITDMERHLQTDEVFVLVNGRGVLLLGGNGSKVEGPTDIEMEIGTAYNIRMNTWHSILLSPDASVLIVENSDTGKENSEYCGINSEMHNQIIALARQYSIIID